MVEAVKKIFSNYANFSGRTSVGDFWLGYLGALIIEMVVSFVIGFVCGLANVSDSAMLSISGIIALLFVIPLFAAEVRRLHDTNKSGWYMLISLIPLVGSILLLIQLCKPSVNENNNY